MRSRSIAIVAAAAAFFSCSQPPPARTNAAQLQDAERAMLQAQYDKAAGHYESFLADNPGDAQRAELRMQIGKCRLGGGQPELAVRAFDQALLEQPPAHVRWEILFRRAVAYRMMGDAARAVESFRTVAAASPGERGKSVTNDELSYEHAIALFRLGDFKTGQAELRRVTPTGPYGKMAAPRLGLTSYTIQVGAFGHEDVARAEAEKIRASIKQVTGSPTVYLVLIGSFSRYDDAQRELTRLQRQGFTDAFILP